MSKQVENKPESSLDQRAVKAWRRLRASRDEPARIEILKNGSKKRAICRLAGVGLRGASVIAKRCQKATGFIERTIYEQVLPHLPVTAPHYYGLVEEDDTFCWLFLEDVGSQRFSPLIEEHRVLAARWLGLTHTAAARMATTARLPDRGPDHYLEHLRSARRAILRSLTNPSLSTDEVAVLKAVVSQCDALEMGWKQVEKCCAGIPATLVHGDFRRKNLYVQTTDQAGTGLFPIDWETAGYGVPAADLAPSRRRYSGHHVDLTTYLSAVRECWPSLDMSALLELVRAGSIFRRLAAIDWASRGLLSEWTEEPIGLLRGYQAELADMMQPTSWAGELVASKAHMKKHPNVNGGDLSQQSDEDVLRQCLERAAPDVFGGPSAIAEIRRSRFELSTSYDAYRVIVRLAGGGEVRIFLKDFAYSLRTKNDPKQRREREVCVYRDLLGGAGLGTARYYGSVLDETSGRLWLLVEYVDGTPVGYCDLGGCWAPAAEGLGRMHGYFAGQSDRLRACDFLISHQTEFFWSAAEHALTDVALVTPHLVGRLENLVRRYAPVVEVMTSQRPTLVHGGCRPANILIRVVSDPARVCILDWEEAAFGAPLFDLAHLVDGIKPPLLDRLVEAYRYGAAAYGMSLPPQEEIKHAVDCFRLHMAFNSLSRAVLKGYKEADIAKLLDYGEGIGSAVFGSGALQLSPSRRSNKPVGRSGETQRVSQEEDQLRLTLERFLSRVQRRVVKVTGWRCKPSPVAGVFPADVLRVSLEGGEKVTLFVKHLGPEQADHPDKQCRDREPRIYEDLLGDDGLPVAQYYGSRWNEVTHRHELFLEYIGDWSLKYQELDHWFAAAPHLARFHAQFAARAAELRARDYLLRLDDAYFHQWAQRAFAVVAEQAPGLADELASVVGGYSRVAEALTQQPVTLVHNDLAPKNVIADRSHDPARICFVDWEMAGVGCGLLDLVHLKHGLDPASDQKICTAYCAELEGTGLLPASPLELRRLFAACELHHTLYRLAHSNAWRLPPDRVAQWVADARNLAGQI